MPAGRERSKEMIHTKHTQSVIFAGKGIRGLINRRRTKRNDRIKNLLKEKYRKYRAGFLDNQHDINKHWGEDILNREKVIALPAHNPIRRFHNPCIAEFWR